MDSFIFGLFAVGYVLLVIWGLRSNKKWTLSSMIYLVAAALIYDNTVYALGIAIGEGPILETLNLLRYWFHALFTPTLILFSVCAMSGANIKWAQQSWVLLIGVLFTITAMIVEYTMEIHGLILEPIKEYGALSYTFAGETSGPPVMILMVLLALLTAGIMLWWKAKWPWMLVGTAVMAFASAVPHHIDSNAITNAFELFLLFTLIWTNKKLDLKEIAAA